MRPNPNAKAHALAVLEATLSAEMVKLQTFAHAATRAQNSEDLREAVTAWLADWSDYQRDQASNPLVRACLPVALGEVSAVRVTAAVWHHFHAEPPPHSTTGPAEPASIKPAGLAVVVPQNVPAKLPVEITINGGQRLVAACVAKALREVAGGAECVRMRPETRAKLEQQAPEAAALLGRDPARKVIGKLVWYKVRGAGWCQAG